MTLSTFEAASSQRQHSDYRINPAYLDGTEVADLIAATPNLPPGLVELANSAHEAHLRPEAFYGQLLEATRDTVVSAGMSFLERMFRPSDLIELRALDPAGRPQETRTEFGRLTVAEDRARLERFIGDNHGQRNIYFGINPRRHRGGKAQDVAARRNVVLDLDFGSDDAPANDLDRSATLAALSRLSPSAVVASGGGFHVWFPIEELEGTQLLFLSAGVLAPAMNAVHSDNMADPARIIRLPGTINIPNAGKRAKGRRMVWSGVVEASDDAPARSADTLAGELVALSQRVGLPNASAASRSGSATTNDGEKTPSPAPSEALLRLALSYMPNHSGGPFDDRDAWQAVGHAIKGAAVAAGIEPEAREMWVDWCSVWGGSSDEAERFWDTCHTRHVGWGTLMRHLQQHNPQGYAAVETAERAAAVAAIVATPFDPAQRHLVPVVSPPPATVVLDLKAVQPPPAQAIPPRRWYYGRNVMGGFVSMLVAPGGTGKSALVMGEALAMATGRNLFGDAPVRPLKVWLHNAEDDNTEALRRLTATLMQHGLRWPDLNGNIVLTSGRDLDLMLAVQTRDGGEVRREVVESIISEVQAASVDVIVFDPLGAMHTLNENSNEAANLLMGALREVAHRTGAGVTLVHHSSKAAALDMGSFGVGASRGASAFTDAARIVRQLIRMTAQEADRFGIARDQCWRYIRVENGKSNMAPAAEAQWFELASVSLNNGAGLWPAGDEVGVVRRWTPPGPISGSLSQLMQVQAALTGAPPDKARESDKSPQWVGYLVAHALGMDIGAPGSTAAARTGDQQGARVRVKSMLNAWIADGSLRVVDWHDAKAGKPFKVVAVGEVALPFDEGRDREVA